jgi:hypothetical protein
MPVNRFGCDGFDCFGGRSPVLELLPEQGLHRVGDFLASTVGCGDSKVHSLMVSVAASAARTAASVRAGSNSNRPMTLSRAIGGRSCADAGATSAAPPPARPTRNRRRFMAAMVRAERNPGHPGQRGGFARAA